MAERILTGVPAAPGVAAGIPRLLEPEAAGDPGSIPPGERVTEERGARDALSRAADELGEMAQRLRADGRGPEAEIVETSALMAGDPALAQAVSQAVLERGLPAAAALVEAAGTQAEAIAAVDDPTLAARADDVRSVGRRAARLLTGSEAEEPGGEVILVARDLGPADVAELGPEVRGIALAAGAVTAHAAIVARSLGLPMVVGLGEGVLDPPAAVPAVVDGSDGVAVLEPGPATLSAARTAAAERTRAKARAQVESGLPARTTDGHDVSVLVNAATMAEAIAGLEAGAEGAGLIRTELAFLDAPEWPSVDEHRRALEPVLAALSGTVATVRVLDFGGDKTPPFLAGTPERGIELLLKHPDALGSQLRAVLAAGRECELRILLPMVSEPRELRAACSILREIAASMGVGVPAVGAMVETPGAVANASELAQEADFLSIGTNDLSHSVLGVDRFSSQEALAYDPRVLRLIGDTVRAARRVGVPVEVCGEAASDPVTAPLLIGLGANELSVGAARVGAVRAWMRALAFSDCRDLALRALQCDSAKDVERIAAKQVGELELAERADAAGEGVERRGGILPVGPQT